MSPLILSEDEINAVSSPPVLSQQNGRTLLRSQSDGPPPAYYDIIEKTLNSEEGQGALCAEIKKLGDSAASVETCFKKVARELTKILEVAMTELQKSDMQKLKETWDKHYKMYLDLRWQSRGVAGHARTIATDFAGDFLSVIRDEKYSVAEKKKEIENYRKEVEHDRKNSRDLSQSFCDLQSAVVDFQADFRQYAAGVDKLDNEVEELIKEIQKVGVQLTELTKANFLSTVANLGLEPVPVGTLAIGVICPSLWERAVSGFHHGIEYCNLFNRQRDFSKCLDKKKQVLLVTGLEESSNKLKKISAIVASSQSDIDFVQEKLGIFSQIWIFVHADLNQIEKNLDLSLRIGLQDYFTKKIQAVSTVYKTLAHALELYETHIR